MGIPSLIRQAWQRVCGKPSGLPLLLHQLHALPTWNFNGLHFISMWESMRLSVCLCVSVCGNSGLAHVLTAILSSLADPLCTVDRDVYSVMIMKWVEHRIPEPCSAHSH